MITPRWGGLERFLAGKVKVSVCVITPLEYYFSNLETPNFSCGGAERCYVDNEKSESEHRYINISLSSNGRAGYSPPLPSSATTQEAASGGKGWNAASRSKALLNPTARKEVKGISM